MSEKTLADKINAENPIWDDALTLCRDMQRGVISSEELMSNIYRRIKAINPHVNAIVSLLDEETAMELAVSADQVPISDRGPLHGIPMAPKDAVAVKGFPTTRGFAPFAKNIEKEDELLASRLRDAGAIFIGHTNMPEFGLGSNTFNSVFGATRNPYDLTRSAGGSSGGAAAALATKMLPLADGSDMGGSLRNPASFCNVVGFRPSIGRTPKNPGLGWYGRLSTTGPMARSVKDAILLMSIMAGPDTRDPLTLPESGEYFLDALAAREINGSEPLKIALSPTLGGLPIDQGVLSIIDEAGKTFSKLGAEVILKDPPLKDAMECFQTQRAVGLRGLGNLLEKTVPKWREFAKDTATWNIEKGFGLRIEDMIRAEATRTRIFEDISEYFRDFDALLLPAAQVAPFDLSQEWISEIAGIKLDTYIDWMSVCCMITVTGLPAISVPGGFTDEGLPVGIQLVGKPNGDLELLKIAHAYEAITKHHERMPELS